ncbi:CoA-binding protein [Patescibacteria group bacterium]|nr:CoA-binding protein [Patescibacteria group bacterium]
MDYKNYFKEIKTIAVVGLSDKPERYSYQVANYLIKQGFRIIPVNPNINSVFGLKSHKSLQEVSEPIDVVDIFRRSEFVAPIVDEAIKIGAKSIWMQEGVSDEAAAAKARSAGLTVIMNMCMMKSHKQFNSSTL